MAEVDSRQLAQQRCIKRLVRHRLTAHSTLHSTLRGEQETVSVVIRAVLLPQSPELVAGHEWG